MLSVATSLTDRRQTICVSGKPFTIVQGGQARQGWKTNLMNILDAIRASCDGEDKDAVTALENAATKIRGFYAPCYIIGDMILEGDYAIMSVLEAIKFFGTFLHIVPAEMRPGERVVHVSVPCEALELQRLLDDDGHWDEIEIVTTLPDRIELFDKFNDVYDKVSLAITKKLLNGEKGGEF